MIKKTISLVAFLTFGISASYMYIEDMALSFHGEQKSYGRDCTFIDIKLNVHTYHIGGRESGAGIHGCPVFTPIR